MLLKIRKTVSILRSFVSFAVALSACLAADGKEDVFHPVRDRAETTSLNGEWDIELAGRRGKIRVPGNWETQGWKTPQYGCVVDDMTGIYRRTFDFSPRWKGRRVVLRFDGVLFGLEVEINGRAVGTNEGASAFNLVQFDVTDFLVKGENEIKATVRSRSRTWLFDTNDCWGLCGIFRDVELFSVPSQAWIEDVTFTTSGTNWTARVDVGGPGRDSVKVSTALRGADRCGGIRRWTPETPNLYDLVVTLEDGGRVIQRVVERVGFRDIEVRADGIFVNGERVFIKGVNWNEIDPFEGRALSFETFFGNMSLMKSAGINTIRTAHYPFSPKFYDLADMMGFWIIDEVPIATRGCAQLADPSFRDDLLARAEATVRRDKNRPSVLIWSCGNENKVEENTIAVLDYMKKKDPTRPRLLPMRNKIVDWIADQKNHFDFGKHVDIYSGHYLSQRGMEILENVADKPVMMTEFAHSRKGLKDFEKSVARMRNHPDKWVGACVWQWRDQAILHDGKVFRGLDDEDVIAHWTGDGKRKWGKEKQGKWLEDGRIYDNWGFNGCDGIIYADMEPKEQFWRVKKTYSEISNGGKNP